MCFSTTDTFSTESEAVPPYVCIKWQRKLFRSGDLWRATPKVQDPSPLIAMPRGEGRSAMHERGGEVGVNSGYPPKL